MCRVCPKRHIHEAGHPPAVGSAEETGWARKARRRGSTPRAKTNTPAHEAALRAFVVAVGTGSEHPPAREAALTATILRIGAGLDLDTVLNEVVESTRALTGAACGVITTVDEASAPRDFVTSELHRRAAPGDEGVAGRAEAVAPTSLPRCLGRKSDHHAPRPPRGSTGARGE